MIKNNIIFNAYNNLLKTYCIKIDNSCAYIDSTYIIMDIILILNLITML